VPVRAPVRKGTFHDYSRKFVTKSAEPRRSVITTPLPHTYLKPSAVPVSYDIRNMSGFDFSTHNKNQHQPKYARVPERASARAALIHIRCPPHARAPLATAGRAGPRRRRAPSATASSCSATAFSPTSTCRSRS
jgi:hypothetical protein